jgi:predicted transposase/invertase (TIGR01784 family)
MNETDKNYLQNPHDKFFKELFSEKEEVTEFITQTFPKEIVQNLNLDTLELDNTSFVDEELQEHFSDLVYNCVYQGKISLKITLLFEHKSFQPATSIQFQLMRYMLRIWEQNISQKEKLSPIIPIIIYHGKNEWKRRDLSQYFVEEGEMDSSLIRFLPQFDYLLTDLTTYQDAEIKQIFKLISLQTGLLLMKKIFEKQLEDDLKVIFEAVNELLKTEKGKRIFQTLLLYLYYGSKIEMEKIMETMSKISLEAQEETLSLGQRLELKGRVELISTMLQNGLKPEEVAKYTGISLESIEKIQQKIKKQ